MDVVVATILNGMVSPDTRAVLLSGEHPLLANGVGATGIQNMSPGDPADADMSTAAMDDAANGQATARAQRKQNGGGKQAALQGRPIGKLPQLSGLPQIIGLALGSPEFQRR